MKNSNEIIEAHNKTSDIVSARASRLETIELQPWTQAEQLQELGDDDQD